ncbi:Uncharacterised protein [Enterobacter hormaechei]|nr:Uncharacterised protein [Enterobacter hormaechei]SAC71432.1 Uncharacterised protein [Enterobacter hormaechei]SAE62684.1 Uncharacterised protein [Enterobacter hormaechei]
MIVDADPSAFPGRLMSEAMEKAIKLPAMTSVPIPATNICVSSFPPLNNTDSMLAGIPIPITSQIMAKLSGRK